MNIHLDRRHFIAASTAVVVAPLLPDISEATLPLPNIRRDIQTARTELMKAFASASQNTYRGEIRRFRGALKNVIDFSEELARAGISRAASLAHHVRYIESYWYEKEYGDSRFEPIETHAAIQKKIGGAFETSLNNLENWASRPEMSSLIESYRARPANDLA